MPQQNPTTRIEQVALDLGRVAGELGRFIGPEARTALLFWRRELLDAVAELLPPVKAPRRTAAKLNAGYIASSPRVIDVCES